MAQLIKRIRVVQDYLVLGIANSSSPNYWQRDFSETRRIAVGKSSVHELQPLVEMTEEQLALFGAECDA